MSNEVRLSEEDEGFDGVCSLCGTDCGSVAHELDRRTKLAKALELIAEITEGEPDSLPAQINRMAKEALRA